MTHIPFTSRLPVPIRRAISRLGDHFFLSCKRCGRMFGGWEVRKGRGGHMLQADNYDTQWITCLRCPGYYDQRGQEMSETDYWMRIFKGRGLD